MFMGQRTFQTDVVEKNSACETSMTKLKEKYRIEMKCKLELCDLHLFNSQVIASIPEENHGHLKCSRQEFLEMTLINL